MTQSSVADVSVVIPAYNGMRFIKHSLESVVQQSEMPSEIIVVDDCSTDHTCDVVAEFARTSPIRVALIKTAINSGSPSGPMNRGIGEARGALIAVLDQDDVFCPEKIRSEASALRSWPDISIAWSLSATIDAPTRPLQDRAVIDAITQIVADDSERFQVEGNQFLQLLLIHGCFPMGFPGFMFRKSDWIAKGGIDVTLRIADHDFLCWLATRGDAMLIRKINYLRRIHDANLSSHQPTVGRDYVEVLRRHLAKDQQTKVNSRLRPLRDQIIGIAYLLRDSGRYRESLWALRSAANIWGWRPDLMTMAAKLPLHWAWTQTCRPHQAQS